MAQAASSILPISVLQQAAAAQVLSLNSLTATQRSVTTTGPIHHASQIGRFRYSPLAGVPVIANSGTVGSNNTLAAAVAVAAAVNGFSTTSNSIEQDIYAANNLQQITSGKYFL